MESANILTNWECPNPGETLTWGPIEQDTGAAAHASGEQLRVAQRQLHGVQDGGLHGGKPPHVLPPHVRDRRSANLYTQRTLG